MDEKFESALGYLLLKEQGLNVDPKDLGGVTNFGIAWNYAKHTLPNYGIHSSEELKHIQPEQVKHYYYDVFWTGYHIDKITNDQVRMKAFEFVAATGRQLKILGGIEFLNQSDPAKAMEHIGDVQRKIYLETIRKHPEQRKWLKGWLLRTKRIPEQIAYDLKKIFADITGIIDSGAVVSTVSQTPKKQPSTPSEAFFTQFSQLAPVLTLFAKMTDQQYERIGRFLTGIGQGKLVTK